MSTTVLQLMARQNSAYARHYMFRLSQPHTHDIPSEADDLKCKAIDNQRHAKSTYANIRQSLNIKE